MAFRRIRLQSFEPFPLLRVWFLISQNVVDIRSLKRAISTHLSLLKDLDIQPTELVLEIDDFELLDDCSIDLVHEGDILMIRPREPAALEGFKRKANVDKNIRTSKRRRRSVSSEDSSSVSSSSTSGSSTTASSDSASSSSPSSDSNSADSRLIHASKVLVHSNTKDYRSNGVPSVGRSHVASHVGAIQANVPPGFGKPSTHSRNQRRKLRRKHAAARASSQKGQTVQLSGVTGNAVRPSTGDDRVVGPPMQTSVQPPHPGAISITPHPSVSQKSKANGSRMTMEGPVPQKLVFNPSFVATASPTVIPPSEREDLPNNLLVTSVEIDWRRTQGLSGRHGANEEIDMLTQEDNQAVQASDPKINHSIDWTATETNWDKYETLDASIKLLPDTIVAWKAFGLDPVSLTPQASMLYLGRVVSADMENVLVQPLTRPNIGRASFGRASVGDEQEELAEQVSKSIKEVWSNKWKLISRK